ncbi:MAG: hypothetical protein GDA46_02945 [Bdellovibrionales bacterium]|nr:hypothetical protein [Bdellovibrionales bacterium]
MKTFLILLLFSFYSHSKFISSCLTVFVKTLNQEEMNLNLSYSESLYSQIYQKIPELSIFSKKEQKKYQTMVKTSLLYLESKSLNTKTFQVLEEKLLKAVQSVPQILKIIDENPSPYLNTKLALEIVITSLTKITTAYLSHNQTSQLDWTRFNIILSSIEEVQKTPTAFSLYKIIQTVKDKHSLYEYLNCK